MILTFLSSGTSVMIFLTFAVGAFGLTTSGAVIHNLFLFVLFAIFTATSYKSKVLLIYVQGCVAYISL